MIPIPPSIAAAFAKPAVKWGAIGGTLALLLLYTNWKTYDYMREQCEQSKLAALTEQAQEFSQQALAAAKMSSAVSSAVDRKTSDFMEKVTAHERKVARNVQDHITRTGRPCAVEPGFMQQLDEYARLLNESTPHRMSTADGGTGEPVVPGGGLGSSPSTFVLEDEAGEPVELTGEELNQYFADRTRQFGRQKLKHYGLSEFELQRQRSQEQALLKSKEE